MSDPITIAAWLWIAGQLLGLLIMALFVFMAVAVCWDALIDELKKFFRR